MTPNVRKLILKIWSASPIQDVNTSAPIYLRWHVISASVADPDPEGSETFGRNRIRSGTEINILDPDSNPNPK